MMSKNTQEQYPILETLTKYIRADEFLDFTHFNEGSVRDALGNYVRNKVTKGGRDIWDNAQAQVTVSDKPNYVYKIKLAMLSWVDAETKRQMNEEDEARFRYTRIGRQGIPEWDAHITYPKNAERDQVTVDMDASSHGIILNFTNYSTLTGSPGQVLVAMEGPHPKIYVWNDCLREDPTKIISLANAYVGDAKEKNDGNDSDDEGEDCDCLTGRHPSAE